MNFNELLAQIPPYPFAEVDKIVLELKNKGIKPIDFGVGDPIEETPEFIRNATKEAIDNHKVSGYPSYDGSLEFRTAVSTWFKRRFNVSLNPENDISALIGSKEGIFHFHNAVINKGDQVIIPDPGYPPYEMGTLFSGGMPYFTPLKKENDFFLDLESTAKSIIKKTKLIWVNYPNSPTTKLATKEFYKELIDFAHDNDIIIASDEAYSEIYYDKAPIRILEMKDAYDVAVVVQSLSKRSNMTSYRIGWVCGNEEIVSTFKKVKTNIDSGVSWFIQDAAIAALKDEKHVEEIRKRYAQKKNILVSALKNTGLDVLEPEATFYIWQKCPKGHASVDFTKRLLHDDLALVTVPGAWISKGAGENYIRIALVPELEEIKKAAERLESVKF